MKKLLHLLLLLSIITFCSTGLNAGDRMMLIEFFTSSTCPPCATNSPILTAFMNSQNPDMISAIGYHMNWPSPGNDPMYLHNTSDNNGRRTFYNVNSIPQAYYDGLINVQPPYSQSGFLSYFNLRKDLLSPVTIIVRDSTYGDSVLVRVHILCETFLDNPNVTLQMVVYENEIHYPTPPGTNGEKDFYWVMRKMLPSSSGTSLILYPGDYKVLEFRYKMHPDWAANQIRNMAFIQAADKEILNSSKTLSNFCLLTSQSYFVIQQGLAATKNFNVKIPYVAQGFNSPVSFTAAIEPNNAGISVSFPSGNTISNFPDSLSVQINSTASVPTGTYRVILTGTSVSGKVHKIAVDYLVGKNYVTVKTSNPTLNFKVDNVSHMGARTFNWDLGSTHTVQAISPQTFGNTRYVFLNWSDAGDTTHNITVNATTSEYTANFKTQFRLLTAHQPSSLPITITGGNTFYDTSVTASVTISPTQLQFNGKMYYFNRWVGAGNGSYNGTTPNFQVTMNNPINQIAIYDTIDTYISKLGSEIPSKFDLYQNYPNPFNPVTKIEFDVAKSGYVKMTIYDITGRLIETAVNTYLSEGKYQYVFNAGHLPSGLYFYRMETEYYTFTKRMIVIK